MKGIEEYRIGNAIVRVHPGKRTPEERRAAIEKATIEFMREVEKQRKRLKASGNDVQADKSAPGN